MDSQVRDLPFDATRLCGLSQRLLESHHQNNYAGAVRRLNAIRTELRALDLSQAAGFELNGLKREELIAANSMLLHELYFASLGATGEAMAPAMELALAANFGSLARWREEFVAMGKALGGGSGWVLLTFQPHDGTLMNQWAADHTHALAGGIPILALDMYEHAYHMDFGAAAAKYVDAFMANIDWERVYQRYQTAVERATETLGASCEDARNATLIDVRRAAVFDGVTEMVEGAHWRDPALVDEWSQMVPKDRKILVYCVYGHEVGRSTALRLRAAGVDAGFIRGGFDGWKAAGGPLQSARRSA